MEKANQIELLRRYEPVLRFTRGEAFLPWDLSEYINECSLWVVEPDRAPVCLVPEGELDLKVLSESQNRDHFRGLYYLQFVSPPNIRDLAVYQINKSIRKKGSDDHFHAGSGRLARVGYISRLVDALFSVSLLARGRVPGDAALSSAEIYRQRMKNNPIYRYYGRVIHDQEWTVLQYWFFYPFNNWRTGFFGLNDHEADWEQISVYLYQDGDELKPEWVAYAVHDYEGDDLRRRWDDPDFQKLGSHPVVYVGAGSHASYFQPGEYLTEIPLTFLNSIWLPFVRIKSAVSRLLQREPRNSARNQMRNNMLIIPFVDYARGDGKALGYGQALVWDFPVLLDDDERWVKAYTGLWGMYARDPVSGENAPAGPRYNQDGTVRLAWHNPIGWAGLDKILPPPRELVIVKQRIERLANEIADLRKEISKKQDLLIERRIDAEATRLSPSMKAFSDRCEKLLEQLSGELIVLNAKHVEARNLSATLSHYADQLAAGVKPSPKSHLHRLIRPADPALLKVNRIAEAWAALSVGLLLVSFILILIFARQSFVLGLVIVTGGFIFFEAIFRGRINQLIVNFSIVMAGIAILILVFEFLEFLLIGFVLLLGGYIMWENLRELWV